jgi:hypothetical protein
MSDLAFCFLVQDLMLAGLFKLGWSISLILGAFFFIRSLLTFVNNQPPFNKGVWQGWVLACCFFVDAYFLGECLLKLRLLVLEC